jgi:hypothetical protein
MRKEYNDRGNAPLVNPSVIGQDFEDKNPKVCKECGVQLTDVDVSVCYECYCENQRHGNN